MRYNGEEEKSKTQITASIIIIIVTDICVTIYCILTATTCITLLNYLTKHCHYCCCCCYCNFINKKAKIQGGKQIVAKEFIQTRKVKEPRLLSSSSITTVNALSTLSHSLTSANHSNQPPKESQGKPSTKNPT